MLRTTEALTISKRSINAVLMVCIFFAVLMPREPDAGAAKGANWKFKWARWEEIRALFRACVDKVGFESRIRKKGKLAEWIGVLDNGAITPRRARKWLL